LLLIGQSDTGRPEMMHERAPENHRQYRDIFLPFQQVGIGIPVLERDDFSSNRHPALSSRLSMICSENRCPLFRIMLY
jgi:hypothetical protein